MDFLLEQSTDIVESPWFLTSKEESAETETREFETETREFNSSCKRKNCTGTLKCIGLNPGCNVDREEKPLIHGACFTCSECGDKPQRRAAWIRYCSLCEGAFAENGFFQHHGGISSRKGEKKLEKRSAAHKKALYLKLNELASKFPYGEKTSEILTLETLEQEIPLLPMEQKWLFASLHFPSTTEDIHMATMSSGWVQSAISFVEDMKQVRRLTLDDLMKMEKENRILIKKKSKKKKVTDVQKTNSPKKRRRSDMEQEEEEDDDIVAVMSSLPYDTIDSDTSDPDDQMDGLPYTKRAKVHHAPSVTMRRWYSPEGSPRTENFFEEAFGVLSEDHTFDQDNDLDDLDVNSKEVFSVLCKGIDGHFVFSKNPTKLIHPIGSY